MKKIIFKFITVFGEHDAEICKQHGCVLLECDSCYNEHLKKTGRYYLFACNGGFTLSEDDKGIFVVNKGVTMKDFSNCVYLTNELII